MAISTLGLRKTRGIESFSEREKCDEISLIFIFDIFYQWPYDVSVYKNYISLTIDLLLGEIYYDVNIHDEVVTTILNQDQKGT